MSLLDVQHLTHRYGSGRPVLHDVNLEVGTDEVIAIVGESGCGKTTLGKLIAGLMEPSRGRIGFEDRNVADLRGRARRNWRREVQMVHQDPYGSLNPGLTLGSTLAPGLLRHRMATRRTVNDTMLELLQQVGLDATGDFLHRYPHQLSGGQRQRLSIARAIGLEPKLIVADEVTSMLDVSMRVAILDLLLQFQRERGISYAFISHDFGVVRYFARGGRILVMFYGHIVEEGPSERLITGPQHPYTHMLLEAIPVPDPEAARERGTDSESSHLISEPSRQGCIFVNRCPLAQDICREQKPPLTEVVPGHRTACFFPDRIPPLSHIGQGGGGDAQTGSEVPALGGSGDVDLAVPDPAGSSN